VSQLPSPLLPPTFAGWFTHRGWQPHAHQLAMLAAAEQGQSALLVAPTGGGKTLAGFLPTLIELAERPRQGLHTLYLSPLKALAVDIQRNLETPIAELRLPIRAETRTGDTPQNRRARQRRDPPHILMTTPESLALLLSTAEASRLFRGLRCIILDELHALVDSKRGELLSLGLARLSAMAPRMRRVGLSATVRDIPALQRWLSRDASGSDVTIVRGVSGARPQIDILTGTADMPWGGHMGFHALPEVYAHIRQAGVTIVFVNTRAQAELVFQELWRLNDDSLPIALHHGSLAIEQRRKVEAAMSRGGLRAVVATSSLDLGIDWGAVDLVVQIGAPKGVARLLQRIGRSNHRFNTPSRALLVPANRFEMLECQAAIDAIAARELDGDPPRSGGLDVLAQHVLGTACSAPINPDALFAEIRCAAPYADLSRGDFDAVVDYVATGGYALRAYDRYHRLVRNDEGLLALAQPALAQSYRLNIGTIVEEPLIKVRLRNGRVLGEVEEYFVNGLTAGDSFLFAGQMLTFVAVKEHSAICLQGGKGDPAIPVFAGGRLPLSTYLAQRVRGILSDPTRWPALPASVSEWLRQQRYRSELPTADGLLVESFPHRNREFLVAYCFEGRNAHQTLGMLLTRRMERLGLGPLGFVATDYVLAAWSLRAPTEQQTAALFDREMMGDDLEEWMAESSMLRRVFRHVAVIAGLVERRRPGEEKTGRQVTVSTDLLYDTLRRHDPEHILLRAAWQDAARGLTDIRRLSDMLGRVQGHVRLRRLERISPLAVPVLLEIGREQVFGSALDELLEEAAEALVAEALPELARQPDADQGRLAL
jgi:ATP-dependent helicase Lhr and Lhr-like helicase